MFPVVWQGYFQFIPKLNFRQRMMNTFPYQRVVVTGGAGFLGSYVVAKLQARGVPHVFIPRRREYDLVQGEQVRRLYAT